MEDGILGDLVIKYQWPRVVAVTGALGSGKTEFVLNLARGIKQSGRRVTIADADIINPYFCIRQITSALQKEGFSVLTPPEDAKWSDMSVINPRIRDAVADETSCLLLDVGGDAGGVKALKQFESDIEDAGYCLILIVNAYRPQTCTPEKIALMAYRMESLCGLKVGALVSNSHLMEDTTPADIVGGLDVVSEAGRAMELPVLYELLLPRFMEDTGKLMGDRQVPLWPLERFMKRPWEGSELWSSPTAEIS